MDVSRILETIYEAEETSMTGIFIFVLWTSFFEQLPEYEFKHLTAKDGLPENSCYAIHEDQSGFMWFGTLNGLVRHDGIQFDIFQPDPEDSTSIGGREISALAEDQEGNLWVGTFQSGLFRFDPKTQKFESFSDRLPSPQITFLKMKHNRLWVGTGKGLISCDLTRKVFEPYQTQIIGDQKVTALLIDAESRFWVGTLNGLLRFDPMGKVTTFQHQPENMATLSDNRISCLLEDSYGQIWVGTGEDRSRKPGGGLNLYQADRGTFQRFFVKKDETGLSHGNVLCMLEDQFRKIWIGTGGSDVAGGLNYLDPQTHVFAHFSADPNNPKSMNHNRIPSLYEDRTGLLWIGSWLGGINQLDRHPKPFIEVTAKSPGLSGLSNGYVSCIYEDDEYLWLGTWRSGLFQIEKEAGSVRSFGDSYHVHRNIQCIEPFGSQYLIGSFGGGLSHFDSKAENQAPQPAENVKNVLCILRESGSKYWCGTEKGLSLYNPIDQTFSHKGVPEFTGLNQLDNTVAAMSWDLDRKGFWLITFDGLLLHFDLASSSFNLLPKIMNSVQEATALLPNQDGTLWIGSNHLGLFLIDPERGVIKRWRQKDGLPNDRVWSIIQYNNQLWISTETGLARMDLKTQALEAFDDSDGVFENKFLFGAAHSGMDGRLYFGSRNGFVHVQPEEMKTIQLKHNLSLRDLQIRNNQLPFAHQKVAEHLEEKVWIQKHDHVILEHWQNDISFSYASMNYRNPGKATYQVRLFPYEDTFIENGYRREAIYTNLKPGDYRFEVTSKHTIKPVSVRLTIRAPWWQTPLAYLTYVIVIIGVGFLIFQLRLRSLRIRNRQLQMMVDERTQELQSSQIQLSQSLEQIKGQTAQLKRLDQAKSFFFSNISHEFRTPLTLILGPVRDLLEHQLGALSDQQLRHIGIIERNASRLLALINQILDLAQLESGQLKIKPQVTNLANLVKTAAFSFSSLAERRDIDLKVLVPDEEVFVSIDIEKIETVLNNIIANAFKFTNAGGKVAVILSVAESIEIYVKDTGKGIPKEDVPRIFNRYFYSEAFEAKSSGIGLALSRELIQLHGGEIIVKSEEGFGSDFGIILPKSILVEDSPENVIELPYPSLTHEPEEWSELPEVERTTSIVIVEDHEDVRNYLKSHLERRYRVLEAVNGGQALAMIEKHHPDLVISDVMMPEMDGYELCEHIKSSPKSQFIPVILLTAKATGESKLKGLKKGADDYLFKPFNGPELLARVENLVELRRKLREQHQVIVGQKLIGQTIPSADAEFLKQVEATVSLHMGNPQFGVENLASEVGLSSRQLHRKMRALTDMSTSGFIRYLKMKHAEALLKSHAGTVSEIAYKVGFNEVGYFTKVFRQVFGKTPTAFQSMNDSVNERS